MGIFVSVRGKIIVSFNNVFDKFNDSFIFIPVFKMSLYTRRLNHAVLKSINITPHCYVTSIYLSYSLSSI